MIRAAPINEAPGEHERIHRRHISAELLETGRGVRLYREPHGFTVVRPWRGWCHVAGLAVGLVNTKEQAESMCRLLQRALEPMRSGSVRLTVGTSRAAG